MKEMDAKPMGREVDLAPEDTLPAIMREMLVTLGEDPERDGLRDTPARVLRAFREMTAGYNANIEIGRASCRERV